MKVLEGLEVAWALSLFSVTILIFVKLGYGYLGLAVTPSRDLYVMSRLIMSWSTPNNNNIASLVRWDGPEIDQTLVKGEGDTPIR